MAIEIPQVITLREAADILRSSPDDVLGEIESGRLRGITVGSQIHTTNEWLCDFIANDSGRLTPTSTNLQLEVTSTETADAFDFRWPKTKDGPLNIEHHEEAFCVLMQVGAKTCPFVVGFTQRTAAGLIDRARINVFLGSPNKALQPIVEFAGANDYETTGQLASVIKLRDGKHLRPGEPVPLEYADMPLGVYSDMVVGPKAARSTAVVCNRDDLDVIVRHAAIRARWKKLI